LEQINQKQKTIYTDFFTKPREGIFPEQAFTYCAQDNIYRCPAGQLMKPRRLHQQRRTWEYVTAPAVCAKCSLRSQCTRSRTGRTIHRHENQQLLDRARAQAHSAAAKRERHRRQVLVEGSFADATNNHGFKRSRWRRLWRQQIQDWMIAAIQNIRILVKRTHQAPKTAMMTLINVTIRPNQSLVALLPHGIVPFLGYARLRFQSGNRA